LAGNDSNDGLTVGTALATIQEAVDRVPKRIKHNIVVDIGPGTFTSMYVSAFIIEAGSLTVQGDLDSPTLASGTVSGTADGGSTTQLVDLGQVWTADDLIGKLVLVDGEYRVPYDNDGTNIYFQQPFGTSCNGEAYEIVEQKTVLTGTEPLLGLGPLVLANNHTKDYHLYIYNLKTTGGSVGFYLDSNQGASVERCYNSGSYYGFFSQEGIGYNRTYCCYSTSNGGAGFAGSRDAVRDKVEGNVANNSGMGFYYGMMTGLLALKCNVTINSVTGLWLEGCWFVYCGNCRFTDNSGYGIQTYKTKTASDGYASSGRLSIYGSTTNISNNALGGVSAGQGTFLKAGSLIGTGNGGFGLEVFSGAYAVIDSTASITGSSGDATINDGTTVLDWSTDFASDGDIVVNIDNGCRIERKD
jgi:hypothetical protein